MTISEAEDGTISATVDLRKRGFAMLNRAVKGRLLSMRPAHKAQWELSVVEPLSAVSTMVALISHDLRHPLTVILANAEFLTGSGTESERSDSYQEIRWAVDHMNDMISSLQEFSKGRDTLRPAQGNILDTVQHAIRIASARPEFCRIAIDHRHTGQPTGWFDSHRLGRVVANLVLNACEAVSPDSGHVVVFTDGKADSLHMGVWDNGPGVPAAIRDSVFQPFVTAGKTQGSGLGLAIAKKFVEDHGGGIHLDKSDENGTLFELAIPFCAPDRTAHPMSAAAARALRLPPNMLQTAVTS